MTDGRALLRARMSVRRGELTARQRIEAAAGVLEALQDLPAFGAARNLAGYWAVRGELPLNLVVATLARRGQHYFLPVLRDRRQLAFAEFREGTPLVANRFGIPEPGVPGAQWLAAQDMDVVLVPLLAFDRAGHRLGSGGGWYDSSLAFLHGTRRPAKPLLVGIGYAFQQADALAAEPWDVDLDWVATEEGLVDCRAPGDQE